MFYPMLRGPHLPTDNFVGTGLACGITFIIPVSDTQAYRQFGNSVAIPVVHAVAKQIISVLDNSQ